VKVRGYCGVVLDVKGVVIVALDVGNCGGGSWRWRLLRLRRRGFPNRLIKG